MAHYPCLCSNAPYKCSNAPYNCGEPREVRSDVNIYRRTLLPLQSMYDYRLLLKLTYQAAFDFNHLSPEIQETKSILLFKKKLERPWGDLTIPRERRILSNDF